MALTISRTLRENRVGLEPLSPSWSFERTRILSEALESLAADRTLNILDVGPAEPRTISFVHRFHCRLYVAELFNPTVSGRSRVSPQAFFDSVRGVQFDLCLLWDFINYPDDAAFGDFLTALAGHVHDRTWLYAIGAYSSRISIKARRYAIQDSDRLAVRPTKGVVPRPRSHDDVARSMHRFALHRGALRSGNRLELVLRSERSAYI